MTSPADNATVQSPELKWADVQGATQYKVTILKANSTPATSGDTYSTSWTPTVGSTIADGPFKWYVQSYDQNNKLSVIPAPSDWRHFSLEAVSTSPGDHPDPTFPPDGAPAFDMPAMKWARSTDAVKYQVWYGVATAPGSESRWEA